MTNQNQDKIYIEKRQNIRLIIQQGITLERVLEKLGGEFKADKWERGDEIIIFVEGKDEK